MSDLYRRGDYPSFTEFADALAQRRARQRLRALLTAEAELAGGCKGTGNGGPAKPKPPIKPQPQGGQQLPRFP